jgi:hypothetical protein
LKPCWSHSSDITLMFSLGRPQRSSGYPRRFPSSPLASYKAHGLWNITLSIMQKIDAKWLGGGS